LTDFFHRLYSTGQPQEKPPHLSAAIDRAVEIDQWLQAGLTVTPYDLLEAERAAVVALTRERAMQEVRERERASKQQSR